MQVVKSTGKFFSDFYNPPKKQSKEFSCLRLVLFIIHILVILAIFAVLLTLGFVHRGIIKEERFNVDADGFSPKEDETCVCDTTTYPLSSLMRNLQFELGENIAENACELPPVEQCQDNLITCRILCENSSECYGDCLDDFAECFSNIPDSCSFDCYQENLQCTHGFCSDGQQQFCEQNCLSSSYSYFYSFYEKCMDNCLQTSYDCATHFCREALTSCYSDCDPSFCDYYSRFSISLFLDQQSGELVNSEIVIIPEYLTQDEFYDHLQDYFRQASHGWALLVHQQVVGNLVTSVVQCSLSQHSVCESYHSLLDIFDKNISEGPNYDRFISTLTRKLYNAAIRGVESLNELNPRSSYERYLEQCGSVDCLLLKDEPTFDIIFAAIGTAGGFNAILFLVLATLYLPLLWLTRKLNNDNENDEK